MLNVDFGRVFNFASNGAHELKEDFITEHLALAIRLDPRPFIAAVGDRAQFPKGDFRVLTQVSLPDRSRLDLVLERAGQPFLWVEIKADAGEHGNQLERYASAAKTLSPSPALILLGPSSFWPDSLLPRMVWSDLVEAVEQTDSVSDAWLYVVGAVQRFGLGGGKRMPLRESEVSSPEHVHLAMERLKTFIFELNQELNTQQANRLWWDNYDVDDMLWDQLKKWQRLIYQFDVLEWNVAKGDPPIYLWLGIRDNEFAIVIEARYDVQDGNPVTLLGSKVSANLQALGWTHPEDTSEMAISIKNIAGLGEGELLTWTLNRFNEVESTGARAQMLKLCQAEAQG